MADATWEGGWSFGKRKVEEGTYTLIFEMNRIATPQLKLVVKKIPIIDEFVGEFHFLPNGGKLVRNSDCEVTFRFTNKSPETVHFEALQGLDTGVLIHWRKKEDQSSGSNFYDWSRLRADNILNSEDGETFKREMKNGIHLAPGEGYTKKLTLKDASILEQIDWAKPGTVTITFSTTLRLTIGDKAGPYAKMCPIRFPVTGEAEFIIPEKDARDK